jgi:ABC-type transport system substrate-binding protein
VALALWISACCVGVAACSDSASDQDAQTADPVADGVTLDDGASTDQATDEDDPNERAARSAVDANLVVALRRLPKGLDPLGDLGPWGLRVADDLVFEGLVRRQPQRAPWVEMQLADSCEVSRDQLIDCHLRPGTRFHDGSEVTAEDVVYSLSYWVDPRRTWIRQRHGLTNLRSAEIVDGPKTGTSKDPGRWIRITFSKAEPLGLERLAAIKIVPRKLHRNRANRFGAEPVGTGPMKVVTLDQDRLVLERWEGEGAARPDRPPLELDRVVLRAVNDGAEALTLMRRGKIQLLPQLAPNHVPIELGKPGMAARFDAWLLSPANYDVLLWNVGTGLMKNAGLRRAMHTAVPRSAIEREAHGAPGWPVDAPVDVHDPIPIDLSELVDATNEDVGKAGLLEPRDPLGDVQGQLAARALLDQLGWTEYRGIRRKPEGNLRVIITWDGATGPGSAMARRVREAWRSLGAQAPFATAPWGYLLSLIKKGEFHSALLRMAGQQDDDLYPLFHSRGDLNVCGVADHDLDRALEAFRNAGDRSERTEAEQAIAQRLAQLRVATVLYAPAPVMLVSRRVEGLEFVDDMPRLDRISLRPANEQVDWGSSR